MYIKRLEIVGFKSFPERALVPLSQGISAVVGPNGCGKSNIIDAIRWVMGEQSPKMLRGRNMDDVLFNGSQGRPASALAEVTLTLARSADPEAGYPTASETSVTRRLYRSGDSEYLLNKVPCRLKDVVNFFTDQGVGTRAYGIIEQGRVGWLVDARPEERRGLIDEAAGITRYKQQKKEAERKIESAEVNLVNVSVIKAETRKQLDQITRAAAKAARFKALKDELREIDLSLSARALTRARDKKRALSLEREDNKRLLASLLAEVGRYDLEMESVKLEVTQAEKEVEAKTASWHQMVAARDSLNREADFTRSTLARSEESRVKALGELAHLSTERRRKLEEEARLTGELSDFGRQDDEARQRAEEFKKQWAAGKNIFDAKNREYEESRGQNAKAEREIAALNAQLAGTESLLAHHQSRLGQLQNEAAEAEKAASETLTLLKELSSRKKSQSETLEAAAEAAMEAAEAAIVAERGRADSAARTASAESALGALRAKLEALESVKNNFGWYPEGVKALMDAPELKSAGLIGPLAEYLEAPDGYEQAVEAALGERLAWLLVEDRAAALKALTYAGEHKLGRCGFVCKNELSLDGSGLTKALLGNYQLAENLLASAGAAACLLTEDGGYAGGGLVAGGQPLEGSSAQESAGLLARLKDVEKLRREEEDRAIELDLKQKEAGQAAQTAGEKKEAAQAAESAQKIAASILAEIEKKLLVAETEAAQAERGLRALNEDMAKTGKDAEGLALALAEGRNRQSQAEETARLAALRVEKLKSELAEQNENLEELRSEMEEARTAALESAGRLERCRYNLASVTQWLGEVEESLATRESESSALAAEIEQLNSEAQALEERAAVFPEKLKVSEHELKCARAELEGIRQKQEAKESAVREVRRRREDLNSVLSKQETEMLSLNFSLDKIEEDLKRDWRVIMPGPEDAPPAPEAKPEATPGQEEQPAEEAAAAPALTPEGQEPEGPADIQAEAGGEGQEPDDAAETRANHIAAGDDEESAALTDAPRPEFEILDPCAWLDYPLPEEAEAKRLSG